VEKFFGLRIAFGPVQTTEISDLFNTMPDDAWREFQRAIYSASDGPLGLERMRQSTYDRLRSEGVSVDLARRFAQPYLSADSFSGDLKAVSSALLSRHLAGLAQWRTLRAADGEAIIGDKPYNEWMAWGALGYGTLPFDVVLTNELVASAEYQGNSIHSMLRGGVSIGTTFYSRTSSFHAYVMFSTFMFSNELPQAVAIRGEGDYSEMEAAMLAGTYLAHELGHLLLHLGHPYDNEACAMRPVVLLQFRSWSEKLDPGSCSVGSEPQMSVGAARFHYDKRFVR
jgi:hypothetical protein